MVKRKTTHHPKPFDWGDYPPLVTSMDANEEWLLDLISNAPKSTLEIKEAWSQKTGGERRSDADQHIANLSKYGIIVCQNDAWALIPYLREFHKACEDFFLKHKLVSEELLKEHLEKTRSDFLGFVKNYFAELAPIGAVLRRLMATVPAIVAYQYHGVVLYGIDWDRHENEQAILYGLLI